MKKVLLTILDGVGVRNDKHGNAFNTAHRPNFDYLFEKYPNSKLEASGTFVGLPDGQMGNSEVGHMNIGAGRIVYQPLTMIDKEIENKTFYQNEKILDVMGHVRKNNSKLHLFGLLSDGGVHSHINHLFALLDMCKMNGVDKVYIHICTDGRDVDPKSSYKYIKMLEDKIKELGIGEIATIGGRYYGMDRDNNYDRLKLAYDAIVEGKGEYYNSNNIKVYLDYNYDNGITDEFLPPTIFTHNSKVEDNDGFITFNFRKDRIREMLTALTNPEFNDMNVKRFNNLKVLSMMPVVESVKAPFAFSDPNLNNIIGDVIANNNLSQLRIAETEKYAHVTFFFDGGKEINYPNEDKILIPSPKVATYDLMPSMSAYKVTDELLKSIDKYDFIVLNFANGDMVGHTELFDATVKAVEVLDECIGKIYKKCKEIDMTMVITADHGNCDYMLDDKNNVVTSHSKSLVPFIITDKSYELKDGKLGDIAPTILSIMELSIPSEMTGEVLASVHKS